MKLSLYAATAAFVLGLAACGGETPAPETPAPAAETPAETAPAAASADGAPTDVAAFMKTRQENYKDIGRNMKVLQDNMKAASPDVAAVTAAATAINGYANQMATWFPAGTGPESGNETEAKANIWTDRATFDAAIVKLQEESAKLAAVTDAAGFQAQFPATGMSCKGCHDVFREQKDN
jgi:cytochrome c556